jgi:MerR family transcriptional regulator, heat shock protein HspR
VSTREEEPVYGISIAARLLRVTPRLLRLYEEAGLITPHRTTGNTRLYSENDMKQLAVVCYLHQKREVNPPGIKVILNLLYADSADAKGKAGGRSGEKGEENAETELWKKIREFAPQLFR